MHEVPYRTSTRVHSPRLTHGLYALRTEGGLQKQSARQERERAAPPTVTPGQSATSPGTPTAPGEAGAAAEDAPGALEAPVALLGDEDDEEAGGVRGDSRVGGGRRGVSGMTRRVWPCRTGGSLTGAMST